MAARAVDQFCIFSLIRCADFENVLRQHFGEADDRIQGRAELVTYGGDEADSVRIRPLRFEPSHLKCVFLSLSLTDVTEDGNNIFAASFASSQLAFERPALHFGPHKSAGAPRPVISLDAKLKRAHIA